MKTEENARQIASEAGREAFTEIPFRRLPAVNDLVDSSALAEWRARAPRSVVVETARAVLGELRNQLAAAGSTGEVPTLESLAAQVIDRLAWEERPRLRPVINATGI